jgi:signal transduction histidine kinase
VTGRVRLPRLTRPIDPSPQTWESERIANVVRALVLVVCGVLTAISPDRHDALPWFPLLIAAAAVGSVRQQPRLVGRIARIVEAVTCAVAILGSDDPTSPLFPYLIAPAFAGGLLAGPTGAFVSPGFAALTLISALPFVDESVHDWGVSIAEWVLLAVAVGLLSAWIRRLLAPNEERRPPISDSSYAAAYRLLSQLRPVARQLSVGLDPGTIAQGLLQSLKDVHDFERGAVYVRTGAGRLVPLAYIGSSRIDWDVDVTGDGPFAEAWLSQRPQRMSRQLSGPPGSALVIPLVIGLRTFGLVGFETVRRTLGPHDAEQAARLAEDSALRLETALLFDDVRGLATAEERRRVAREIHDGIAQELSYIGYFVDGLAAEARSKDEVMEQQLVQLRTEITRIVSELRMSIFDLRSEVDVHGGLGAALSEYVRSVGRQSGLTVHMSLAETPNRLPAETEAELLRIAQEAITNARKHAEAENLWVSLSVDPPGALLRIEDDGRGLGRARADSYGIQIMRERAKRLRTTVDVLPREPRGTVVEVRLGGEAASLTASSDAIGARVEESQPQ